MIEILEQRAKELSQRLRHGETDTGQFFLVSRWGDLSWAFQPADFLSIVAGPEIMAPAGTTLRGHRCSAFLRYEGKILPVLDWSSAVGVEEQKESLFLITRNLEFALRISSRCGLQRLTLAIGGTVVDEEWGETTAADLSALF